MLRKGEKFLNFALHFQTYDMAIFYSETMPMCDVISDQPSLLQMMSRFGIPLGVGDNSVAGVCKRNGVDTTTFLAVANYMKYGRTAADDYVEHVSVEALVAYLKQSHDYFLNFQLPSIRRKLFEAINYSGQNDVALLILKFYDEYMGEVRRHMQHENSKIFTYVDELLAGRRNPEFAISQFARNHVGIEGKLQELKNIIIKYYKPAERVDLLNDVLYDIFNCEADLRQHCKVEDDLFVPAVGLLEERVAMLGATEKAKAEQETELLSEREKEIVCCVVKGMANKEIATHLYISVNTVLTHRKNIARKLDIHSVSGLTIYAIVNKLVEIEELSARSKQ